MKITAIRLASALIATAALAGCSMFRSGEDAPADAALNGDSGGPADVIGAMTAAAPAYASPMPNEMAAAAPIASRSVLYALHIASYRTEASAQAGWRIMTAEAPSALNGLHPRIETVDLGPERGVYLRLKAGPLDSQAEASARCAMLVNAGHYCQAVDFEGRDVTG